MLNDGQTLGNCGFTNQTARPQAPATVGLAFRLSGEYFALLSVWVSVVIAAPLSLFSAVALRVLSFSQMMRLSSWGSSRSPLPQSSLTSWSPKTRAAQPMSRLSSEGGGGQKEGELAWGWAEGGCTGGVWWGWILGEWCLSRWALSYRGQIFSWAETITTQVLLVVNLRAGSSKRFWNRWTHAWSIEYFTQDPSEKPDGLVTTLSVIHGIG